MQNGNYRIRGVGVKISRFLERHLLRDLVSEYRLFYLRGCWRGQGSAKAQPFLLLPNRNLSFELRLFVWRIPQDHRRDKPKLKSETKRKSYDHPYNGLHAVPGESDLFFLRLFEGWGSNPQKLLDQLVYQDGLYITQSDLSLLCLLEHS
jgi:hypothetical protein